MNTYVALLRYALFVDIRIIGKERAIIAHECCHDVVLPWRQTVQFVEVIACERYEQAGSGIGIVLIVDIACPLQNSECGFCGARFKMIGVAKLFEMERKGVSGTASHAYLVEISQMLVNLADVIFGWKGCAEVHFLGAFVVRAIQQHGIGFLPISSRSSRFLKISLYRVRTIVMNHNSYVGLVDAHAESVGGNHNLFVALQPCLLMCIFDCGFKSGMKKSSGKSMLTEIFGQFLCGFTAPHIHDGATLHGLKNLQHFYVLVIGAPNDVSQIASFETHLKYLPIGKVQLFLDVCHHLRCSGSRKRQYRYIGFPFPHFGNMQIMGPEIIAPLADAMCLVDSDEAHTHVF